VRIASAGITKRNALGTVACFEVEAATNAMTPGAKRTTTIRGRTRSHRDGTDDRGGDSDDRDRTSDSMVDGGDADEEAGDAPGRLQEARAAVAKQPGVSRE
jgi:hypothetical protein